MQIFQNWAKKTALTAKETVQKATKEDMERVLDIAGDIAKVGGFVLLAVLSAKAGKKDHVPTVQPRDIPAITIYNYYFGSRKENAKE